MKSRELKNADIRQAAKNAGVYLYEVADEMKMCEATFTRKMRYELPEAEKNKMFDIISKLSAQKESASC